MKLRRLRDLYIRQLEYLFSPPGLPLVAKAGPNSAAPTTTILIRGEAGAGKTTLALALAHAIARDRKGALLVLNTETAPVEVDAKAVFLQIPRKHVLAWQGRSKARKGSILVQHIALAAAPEELEPGAEPSTHPGMLDVLWEMLRTYSDEDPGRTPLAAVMIDGMLLADRDDNVGPTRSDTAAFLQALETRGISTVIVEESAPRQVSWLPFVVDLVFELEFNLAEHTRKLVRQVVCRKSRYTPAFAGPHEYDLDEDSVLAVWPDPLDIDPEILREITGAGEACIFWPTDEKNTFWVWRGAGLVCTVVGDEWDMVLGMNEQPSCLPLFLDPNVALSAEDTTSIHPHERGGIYSLVWSVFHAAHRHQHHAIAIHDLDHLLARSPSPVLFFRAIRALLRGGLLIGVRGNSDEVKKLLPFSVSSPDSHKSFGEIVLREVEALGTERWLSQASALERLSHEERDRLSRRGELGDCLEALTASATAVSSVAEILGALHALAKPVHLQYEPMSIAAGESLVAFECLRVLARSGGDVREHDSLLDSLNQDDPRVSTQRALFWYLHGNDWRAARAFIPGRGLHGPVDRVIWGILCARHARSEASEQWLLDVSFDSEIPLDARRLAASEFARILIKRGEFAEARACIDAVATGLDPWLIARWHAEIAIEAKDEAVVAGGQMAMNALAIDPGVPVLHQAEIFFNLALLAERKGEQVAAQAACERALALNPALEASVQRLRTRSQASRQAGG